ncbi:hypothetical protein ACJX0J_029847, partial [Zea mays]
MKFSIIYVNHHLLSTLATIIILDNSISITGIVWDLSRYEATMTYNFRLAAVKCSSIDSFEKSPEDEQQEFEDEEEQG